MGCRELGVFGFQRLDVYRCAAEFLGVCAKLAGEIPRGNGELVDQPGTRSTATSQVAGENCGDAHRASSQLSRELMRCRLRLRLRLRLRK